MDWYLLETTAISALLDQRHERHTLVNGEIAKLDFGANKYISSIALAEMMFGVRLHQAVKGVALSNASKIIADAQKYPILNITRHTSAEYAELKTILATKYLKDPISKERRRWIEDWVDAATGKKLQMDENDLWMCSQAREKNLVLVTTDKQMRDIVVAADAKPKFLLLT